MTRAISTGGKAVSLPAGSHDQYAVQADHFGQSSWKTSTTIANARLFEDVSSCTAYLDHTLVDIAARAGSRPETKPFANPVAMVEHLRMALSVFPIDGMIPTLVEATDPHKLAALLAETLPEALSGEFLIKDVRLDLAHYGRYERCVLRYSVDGIQVATQTPHHLTVYGKVDTQGLGGETLAIISALRERLQEPDVPYRFRIPHALGYFPDLMLLLMEALPGKPVFKDLLKTWTGNDSQENGDMEVSFENRLTLEGAVRACALIAATLHGSAIKLGPDKTLEMQVAHLRDEI